MKSLLIAITLGLSASSYADLNYYPEGFEQIVSSGSIKDQDLKNKLFTLLDSTHQKVAGGHDILTTNCPNTDCYRQVLLGYENARRKLFGEVDLQQDNRGYFFKDLYCDVEYVRKDVAPNTIPGVDILNCEHTWPQSRFSRAFPENLQKGDLNHLFGVNSQANSMRSSYPFGEVTNGGHPSSSCTAASLGKSPNSGNGLVFEPPQNHKGNVARALFYFSIRYKMPIDPKQEAVLRQWHKDDPVNDADRERNEKIYGIQNNRNPFVDFPELVDDIADF